MCSDGVWREAVCAVMECGGRQCVQRWSVEGGSVCSDGVWREAVCAVMECGGRQCVQ